MNALADEFRALLGEQGVLTGDDVSSRSCDPFRNVPPLGGIILRPANTEQVAEILKFCQARQLHVVTHGGRTGVAGGAYANSEEVILSLERMNKISNICPLTQLAEVEAGVAVEALQSAAADLDLFYPIDLGSKGSATIGGTIATNAGGNRVLRWGMTRQNVLGIEAVLADGTIISSMNRLIKNNTGYDLKHFIIGTEGTIAIVTKAVLRLVPAPTSQFVAFVSVASHKHLIDLLSSARRLLTLSAFEVMWPDYYDLVSQSETGRRPVEPGQAAYVLIEAMGYQEEIDQQLFEVFLKESYEAGLIVDAVTAMSKKQVADLWRVREAAEIIVREMSPFVSFDISVDVREVDDFIHEAESALRSAFPNLKTATFGHLGDNNIHIAAHIGSETLAYEHEIESIVFNVLKKFEGAITAEHGIGQLKREFLADHKSDGEMDMMRRFRRAMDTQTTLNQDVLF